MPTMAKITTSRVVVGADGTVAIVVKCVFRLACVGALSVASGATSGPLESACDTPAVPGSHENWWAQSDLNLPAYATRRFGLTLSPCVRQLLSARRRVVAFVNADAGESWPEASKAEREQVSPLEGEFVTLVAG